MSRRLAAIGLALTLVAQTAPANAGSQTRERLLGAPPAHARAGVCYAHVRREARYARPPGPRAWWRLSPPLPGSPGPVWCLVVERPTTPGLLIRAAHEGWIRVACAPRHRHVRRRPSTAPPIVARPCGCDGRPAPAFIPPVPPPVVRLIPLNPAATYGAPGPRVLTWPGKVAP